MRGPHSALDRRQRAQGKSHRIPSEHKDAHFSCRGQTLGLGAQRGCRVSIHGDAQTVFALCSAFCSMLILQGYLLLSKGFRLAEPVTSTCGYETCSAGHQGSSNMQSRSEPQYTQLQLRTHSSKGVSDPQPDGRDQQRHRHECQESTDWQSAWHRQQQQGHLSVQRGPGEKNKQKASSSGPCFQWVLEAREVLQSRLAGVAVIWHFLAVGSVANQLFYLLHPSELRLKCYQVSGS